MHAFYARNILILILSSKRLNLAGMQSLAVCVMTVIRCVDIRYVHVHREHRVDIF